MTATVDHAARWEPEPLWTVPQVAKFWGCKPQFVYDQIAAGKLRHVRLGRLLRVPVSALDEYAAAA